MSPALPSPSSRDATLRGDLALAAVCALALVAVLHQAFAPGRAPEASAERALGVVEERHNDVRRRPGGALTWQELRGGAPVHEGDAIYAAEDSQALIRLGDGARILLDESSLVVVRRRREPGAAASPALALELLRGGARGTAGSGTLEFRAGGSQVAVDEHGEVRVRRTSEGASVEVASGQVVLASGETALRLGHGQAVLPGTGGPRVVELGVGLLGPAQGAVLYTRGTPPGVDFAWQPPRAGARCELQLSPGADFRAPRVLAGHTGGRLTHAGLGPGLYHWRVRCEDAGGERWSEQRSFRIVEDLPPVAISPRPDEVVDLTRSRVSLAWSELSDEGGYQLELAREGDFSAPALRAAPRQAVLQVERALPEGRYCFRVRADRQGPEAAPWSAPSCFRTITQPILEAPRVYEPRREPVPEAAPAKGAWLWNLLLPTAHAAPPRSALVLRWERIPGAVAYLLEVAEDRAFAKTVVRERVTEPYFRWQVVARRDYFWRVRGVDAHGREGAVSEVSLIGSEVSPPVPGAPAAGARLEVAPGDAVWLRWAGSPVLVSYRVEVARDAAFREEVRTLEVDAPKVALRDLPPGVHHWRVTGVDLHGQSTGASPVRSFVVVPASPQLVAPGAGEAIAAEASPQPVRLAWSARAVSRYQVEWSREGGGRTTTTVTTSTLELPVTETGRYTWRVRGLGPETAWSAPGDFLVSLRQAALEGPADGAQLAAGAPLVLAWRAVPLASGYEVQVEPEGGPARSVQVSGTSLELGALAPGRYRWTVRALGAPPEAAAPAATLVVLPPPPAPAAPTPERVATPGAEVAPVSAPGPASVPPPSPAAGTAARGPRAFGLAAVGGVATNFGAVLAPALSLEASWRAPQSGGRLGVAVRVSAYGAGQGVRPLEGLRVDAQLWSVPIALLAQATVPLPGVDLVLSGGPLARVVSGTLVLSDGTRLGRSSLELGGAAHAGVELPVGPGRLYGEVGLALSTVTQGLFVTTPATLSSGAGYRWEVW